MAYNLSRREFFRQATVAGTAVVSAQSFAGLLPAADAKKKAPNERLNIGIVGVDGRGGSNLQGVQHENIVALCDIDSERLGKAAAKFPNAVAYKDFRKLIDQKGIDAVVVSTPDHTHAVAVMAALRSGRDVYCEKPLTHSVWETRQIRELAKQKKAVTQMGTQVHAGDNYRRAVEIVRSGLLGPIERVHVWFDGVPKVFKNVKAEPVPATIDYDLWTGPAPLVPFNKESRLHFNWRYWWDFGNGMLGDFGCHYMDLPHWALDLRAPLTVECLGEKGHDGDNDCPLHQQVEYHYPDRGALPPVHLTWYQGKFKPEEAKSYGDGKRSAVLFEGPKGRLLADYGSHKVFAAGDFAAPPPNIPKSLGHHEEFLQAIRSRGTTTCNFDYSGALTETVLLGNVSYRAGGKKLEWDDKQLKAVNCPEADAFLRREYRKGWEL